MLVKLPYKVISVLFPFKWICLFSMCVLQYFHKWRFVKTIFPCFQKMKNDCLANIDRLLVSSALREQRNLYPTKFLSTCDVAGIARALSRSDQFVWTRRLHLHAMQASLYWVWKQASAEISRLRLWQRSLLFPAMQLEFR